MEKENTIFGEIFLFSDSLVLFSKRSRLNPRPGTERKTGACSIRGEKWGIEMT